MTEWRILAELCPPLRNEVLMFLNARAVMHIDFFRGQVSGLPKPAWDLAPRPSQGPCPVPTQAPTLALPPALPL